MRDSPPGTLGVFTTAEAHDAGWTRSALAHAARQGSLVQVTRGVWAPPGDPTDPGHGDLVVARRSIAAALQSRGTAVSHLGAATIRGLPTWAPHPRPCVTVVGRTRISLANVHVHRTGRELTGTLVGDVVVANIRRTVGDLAREFGVESALVTADAALRRGLVTPDELRAATRGLRGAGAADAVIAAAMADGRAESPLESRSRWQFRVHEIEQPRPQVYLFTSDGTFLGRCDFYWPEGVVGEVDGSMKYRTDEDRIAEKWRQEYMERTGLLVVRWGAEDLRDFRSTAALIRDRRARVQRPGWPHNWIARSKL